MVDNFDKILDKCIDRINKGEGIESCLADYPSYSEQLRPLLKAALQAKQAYSFVPKEDVKMAAKRRFDIALERRLQTHKEKKAWFSRISSKPLVLVALAATAIVIIAVYFGLNQVFYPIIPAPNPDPEGNFILLISDDVNAIGDFESVNVSITKVGLRSSGSGGWLEFEPEIREVDLTTVQGDKTQQIWRGNIPEGEYTKVFIYVSDVQGILKETEETVEIKLPSNKLQISKSFQITADTATSFTFDLTVISAGSEQSGIKYILKPQAAESGADTKPANNKGKGKQD